MAGLTIEQRHRLAEQVMCWTLDSVWIEGVESKVWSHWEKSGVLGYSDLVPDCAEEQWEPDNDIAQAFMLVEKLVSQGVEFALDIYKDRSEAVFYPASDCRASRTALSICLAALGWLDKKETKYGRV